MVKNTVSTKVLICEPGSGRVGTPAPDDSSMNRRDVLKAAAVGISAVAIDSVTRGLFSSLAEAQVMPVPTTVRLDIGEAMVTMADGTPTYMWCFTDADGPHYPGPVLTFQAGESVDLTLTNTLDEDHAFTVPGVVDSGILAPGETRLVQFVAPAAGTYLYHDPLNDPVNRVLGLHGAMRVLPAAGNTPYSDPTPAVQQLFDDLGTAPHFPGDAWLGLAENRERIWLISCTDPRANMAAMNGQPIDPVQFVQDFIPDYFTLDGVSGPWASHGHGIFPSGNIGEPHLIRILNAGVNIDSLHIHGNHVYVTAVNQIVQPNVLFLDTVTLEPLDCVDWLLPYMRPPDIPGDESMPLRDLITEELNLQLEGVFQSPQTYPMHSHTEQTQTMLGGNYPMGQVTHWEIIGDLDKVPFPNLHVH